MGKEKLILYLAIAVIVIIIAYYAISSLGSGPSLSGKQILDNVSSANLNQTQARFVNDLKMSENVSNLAVSYYSSNATYQIKESNNLTVAVSNNQTIDSYKMGNYNKTVITQITAYTNAGNGQDISKNVNITYYYNTNQTVTCFNSTSYSAGIISNTSVACGDGDQGMSYLEETPFTAANVSGLSYLVFNSTVSYTGVKTIAGRSCDNFIISNATASNLQSNYTVFGLCIDTQYGVPLYFNETEVTGGIPSSFSLSATSLTTNVSSSEFVIPSSYLSTIQGSII
jgi:hypothetical protein